jgi:hypothetical protein
VVFLESFGLLGSKNWKLFFFIRFGVLISTIFSLVR